MKTFVVTLHDWERGKNFRLYAGITSKNIPCEATFTNFKKRLGEARATCCMAKAPGK